MYIHSHALRSSGRSTFFSLQVYDSIYYNHVELAQTARAFSRAIKCAHDRANTITVQAAVRLIIAYSALFMYIYLCVCIFSLYTVVPGLWSKPVFAVFNWLTDDLCRVNSSEKKSTQF